MANLQETLHKLELGSGRRLIKIVVTLLVLTAVFFAYNLRSFKNMDAQEAMDAAQLGRNISRGDGYTTEFIRPLSMYLFKRKAQAEAGSDNVSQQSDPTKIKGPHPDISNPPVYPVVLAGLMKVLPFNYDSITPRPFWSKDGMPWRQQPDFLISLFNELLMVIVVGVSWLLARRLFDREVAWITALCLLGVETLWRFSVSGLSTMLLLVIACGIFYVAHRLESEGREPKPAMKRLLFLAVVLGILVGLGGLTRYAFAWLVVPVVVFLGLFGGKKRFLMGGVVLAVFLAVMAPWIVRNVSLSGVPFGTASYTIFEKTTEFQDHDLERSLNPDLTFNPIRPVRQKLVVELRSMVKDEALRMGGTWVNWFFLVGLLIAFRNPATQRLRYLILFSLVTLMIVQALGTTALSDDSPTINSENLLILLVPVTVMYGVAFFVMLLDNTNWSEAVYRKTALTAFVVVVSLPLLLTLAPPRPIALAYPPYYPAHIQKVSDWMKKDELMMSDVPWAVAWYGDRQCVWLTLDIENDFYAINDYQKPIKGLYLTPVTTDAKLVTELVRPAHGDWGNFLLNTIAGQVPKDFPLRSAPKGELFWPQEVFLTDWSRWRKVGAEP